MKKAKKITKIPVVYTKFVFSLLIEALQKVLIQNSMLESIVLEGLPISNRYMLSLSKGLYKNHSIKHLSFTRSQLGDESCKILCMNIKHLKNIETLNLSHCNLHENGAAAVKDYIRYQKIHRLSESWNRSLRYQPLDCSSLEGLRKVILNNNPDIGDNGLKIITDELSEDVWIKEIEMQNCGLSSDGVEMIIKCLDLNRTIENFNISNNLSISERMQRSVLVKLGKLSSDDESLNSNDESVNQQLTKAQLMDKLKYYEEQLESLTYHNSQLEALNTQMNAQMQEAMNKFNRYECSSNTFNIPEGYTLISNEEYDYLMTRTSRSRKSSTERQQKNIFTLPKSEINSNLQSEYQYENIGDNPDTLVPQTPASSSTMTLKADDNKSRISKVLSQEDIADLFSIKTLRPGYSVDDYETFSESCTLYAENMSSASSRTSIK
jgi:hypothetical protein